MKWIRARAGEAWAWAGRHRLPPSAAGDSIGARATGYYVVLEARRHSADSRTAVAGVLVWAHPAVPDRFRSLTELFRERTEVGLNIFYTFREGESAWVYARVLQLFRRALGVRVDWVMTSAAPSEP